VVRTKIKFKFCSTKFYQNPFSNFRE